MPHLTPRTEEVLSYFTGLAPAGRAFEVPQRQVAADLGFRCATSFHHYLNLLIASGMVRRLERGSGGSTGLLVVLRRLEDA